MSIITISRFSRSQGETIAEKLAAKLEYECISREVLLEASKEFKSRRSSWRERFMTPLRFWTDSPAGKKNTLPTFRRPY